jgi:UvrD/REP helicase N-terminal domain
MQLQRALDFPWEKWTVFLHPEQRQWVERDYSGAARVSGSAGTGKTIVALHRAAHLARTHSDARILLTTFSDNLANTLKTKLRRLLSNEPLLAERIDVHSINAIGLRLYKTHVGPATIISREVLRELVRQAVGVVEGHKFGRHFLLTEWEEVVDAWQLGTWDAYREMARLGRKTRIPEERRTVLWAIFERVRASLSASKLITHAELFTSPAAVPRKGEEYGLRLHCGGRSARCQCRPSPVFCRPRRRSGRRLVFCRPPRAAHLSAAFSSSPDLERRFSKSAAKIVKFSARHRNPFRHGPSRRPRSNSNKESNMKTSNGKHVAECIARKRCMTVVERKPHGGRSLNPELQRSPHRGESPTKSTRITLIYLDWL